MILKGSQRGGPRQLAAHLLDDRDNDHVSVEEIRGFAADNLFGAMAETLAVSRGTKCQQPVFSLSLNPPKDAHVTKDDLFAAADKAGEALALSGQPRAVVFHEKGARLHAHVVWSRIDAETMKAINLPHFKNKLRALSKELFLEHGWQLPDGHRLDGWKNPLNFTLAEFQQAERLGLDPRELKQLFRAAYDRSDNLASFRNALEEHGYYLAQGDRRGVVALDVEGKVFAVARWAGLKSKDLEQKIGANPNLPSVDAVRADIAKRVDAEMRKRIDEHKKAQAAEMRPLLEARKEMIADQREVRENLKDIQHRRSTKEAKERAERYRTGLGVVMDVLTGRLFKLRRQNKQEALACDLRDRRERDQLVQIQLRERKPLIEQMKSLRTSQQQARQRFAERVADVLKRSTPEPAQSQDKTQSQSKGRSHKR
jgi:hypothetical protein